MQILLSDEPTNTFPRYILLAETPAFTNIDGLVKHHDDDDVTDTLVLTAEGTAAQVDIIGDVAGNNWSVTLRATGDTVDEVSYDFNDGHAGRAVYINGFPNDIAPSFTHVPA